MSRRRSVPRPVAGQYPIDTGTARLRAEGGGWLLEVNGVASSVVFPQDPARLGFDYLAWIAAALSTRPPGPLDVLHLGAGACALPRALALARPGSRQVAVEIDAALVTLVRAWFGVPGGVRVRVADAAEVIATRPAASADVVVRDVFAGDRTPARLCSPAFTAAVSRVLRPGGWYAANVAAVDGPGLRREIATIASVFAPPAPAGTAVTGGPGGPAAGAASVGVFLERSARRGRRRANTLVLAGTGLDWAAIARALRAVTPQGQVLTGPGLRRFVAGAPPWPDAPS